MDGQTYQKEIDTGLEPWDEEEVHYDPADPSKCYVGHYARQTHGDDSGTYLGIAVVALVIAVVFAKYAVSGRF